VLKMIIRELLTPTDEERAEILARVATLRSTATVAIRLGLAIANVELRKELEDAGIDFGSDGADP